MRHDLTPTLFRLILYLMLMLDISDVVLYTFGLIVIFDTSKAVRFRSHIKYTLKHPKHHVVLPEIKQ